MVSYKLTLHYNGIRTNLSYIFEKINNYISSIEYLDFEKEIIIWKNLCENLNTNEIKYILNTSNNYEDIFYYPIKVIY